MSSTKNVSIVTDAAQTHDSDAWKKYDGKVTGTPEEIQAALKVLKREPKNVDELATLILDRRRQAIQDVLEQAERIRKTFSVY
jgi:hypothetical protein